jgi:hypothetical protein
MRRRKREEILGQWAPREPTGRELAESRQVARDLEGSPTVGQPLRRRGSYFRPAVDSYVTSLGGPLPYMVRLREIDQLTQAAEEELGERYALVVAEFGGRPDELADRWRQEAETFDFGTVNELIDRHNRWYPVEARLPMDVKRRDYVLVNGAHYSRRRLDAAWVLERFPAERELSETLP